jgi:HEPN domain-containing protein
MLSMPSATRPTKQKQQQPLPHWGAFLYYADWDLIAFAWLLYGQLYVPAYYHASQSIEKYFKSLILATTNPLPLNTSWLNSHSLSHLSKLCAQNFPYYEQPAIRKKLALFTEFDAATRYPSVPRQHGNGFTSEDIPVIWELIRHLRRDIPIVRDDYPLGMVVRGHFQGKPTVPDPAADLYRSSRTALLRLFPDVRDIVLR